MRAPSKQREVKCHICGKLFLTRHSQAKYCPDKCRRLAWQKTWRKYGNNNKEKRRECSHRCYINNIEKRTQQINEYNKTEKGKLVRKRASENCKKKYPEKYKARQEVLKALKKGILKKEPCEVCGSLKVEAHHEDYNKPLEVNWLCSRHHKERERVIVEDGTVKD